MPCTLALALLTEAAAEAEALADAEGADLLVTIVVGIALREEEGAADVLVGVAELEGLFWPALGKATEGARRATIVSSALMPCPTPVLPSKPPVHQVMPQSEPPLPEHDAAADLADACILLCTSDMMPGTTWPANAAQRARYALKESSSVLQVPTVSHAASNITFDELLNGEKKTLAPFQMPCVRVVQVLESAPGPE